MIKRLIPKKLIPVENLTEDITVGTGGIDVTSPPNKTNTVYDMENFDVDTDKGLTLRNPLFFNSKAMAGVDDAFVGFAFDESHLEILKHKKDIEYISLEDVKDVKHADYFENIDDPTDIILAEDVYFLEDWYAIFLDGQGINIVSDKGDAIDRDLMSFSKLSVINTNTSTIILGISFDLNDPKLQHYSKNYALGSSNYKPRPVRITKENNTYKAEIMQIENPTLYTDSDGNVTKASFNLMNDYIYSLKDNYTAGYAYTNGILKYTPVDTSKSLETYTVEDLTESNKFLLVDTITEEEKSKQYILKAFVTSTSIATPNYKLYCTWEKTYDNVTWMPVPEFIENFKNNLTILKIEDSTKSYEGLDNSFNYIRNVQYTPFLEISANNKDYLGNRPDVLLLKNGLDAATYRFSIRSVTASPEIPLEIVEKDTYYEIVSGIVTEPSNYTVVDANGNAEIKLKFKISFKGDVTSAVSNIHLTARSAYTNEVGLPATDYRTSFYDTLTTTALTSDFQNAIESNWSVDAATGNTITEGTVTIPIQLNSNWVVQLLCLNFYLYNGTDLNTYWYDKLSTVVGRDMSNLTPSRNSQFKYYARNLSYNADTNITISGSDSSKPDCYKYDVLYVNKGVPVWDINWRTTNGGIKYVNRDNTRSANFKLELTEIITKDLLPIEMIKYLANAQLTNPYTVYIFNNFGYYFKNIELRFRVNIDTTVWASYSEGFGGNAYKAYANMRVSLGNVVLNLYDYLNLKENTNALINAMRTSYNNIWITESDTSMQYLNYSMDYYRGDYNMSTATYNKIKKFFEAKSSSNSDVNQHPFKYFHKVYTDSPLLYYFTITILEDVLDNRFDLNSYTLNLKSSPYQASIDMLDSHTAISIVTNDMYIYNTDGDWVFETVEDAVFINSPTLYDNPGEYSPESYGDIKIPIFKYLYAYNGVQLPETLIRLDNENTLTVLELYNAMKDTSDPIYVYNLDEQMVKKFEYAILGDAYTNPMQYSLLLAATSDNTIFTQHKSETREIISLADSENIYYNYRIWHFGKTLSNNIYFSNVDTTTVPIENCLTLSTDSNDFVTSLVPWRDYLVATTNTKIFLISKYDDSYIFKQVNTFVGVPAKDSRTCKAILNGIIFKSGTKIFTLAPNAYSSDDTILNIVEISKPISHHLIDGTDNFAIATEYYYYVFIPRTEDTLVFKYEYSRKIWSKYTYPVVLYKAKLFNVQDILVVDIYNNIYNFDKTLDWYKEKLNVTDLQYGDYLNEYTSAVRPIAFYLDTGQKSSNMEITKQFTESKLVVSTKDNPDVLASKIKVLVDGIDLKVSHNTAIGNYNLMSPTYDNPAFSKNKPTTLLYTNNTNFDNDFNVTRQIMLRYMGKGKTIRHTLRGISAFNFKIYMLYYRYRIPHNKQ